MANRVKEDEKNERIIRGLLKLAENRRCINCNSLGPQYVCTTFWTFVCTTCSGIHREFTHRVKSVSMAKFTSQEVKALQEGGNQRSKEIYLKEWDSQRGSLPDSSNVERLRDFIKHVYVDRRYSGGERNSDKPPRAKMGEREDSYENRRTESYKGGSRSPPYDDGERRYSGRSSPGGRSYDEGRSPGYEQESRQHSDYRKSPSRPEVVNDWRRDDRFGNGRRNEDRRMSDGDVKLEGRSPERPKDVGSSSPPVVRPVREILGENTIPLRIIEPPKPIARPADGSAHTQRTASSSSLGSANGNPAEVKLEPSGSLIDFDADPEPPAPAPPQQPTIAQSTPQSANSTSDNWASFDAIPQTRGPQAPNPNSVESVLSQLSVSAPAPTHNYGTPGTNATVASVNNLSGFPLDGVTMIAPQPAPVYPVNAGSTQWPNVQQQPQQQQQPSLFHPPGNQPVSQQFSQSVMGPSNNQQPWNVSPAPNPQGFPSNLAAPSVAPQAPLATDVKPSGRQALPEDLFTRSFSNYRAPGPGWYAGPPGGMGYGMPYNMAMPVQTFQQQPFQQQYFQPMQSFQQPSRSINPFDMNSEAPPAQAPTFPSLASLQGALPNMMNPSGMPQPNMPPSGLMRTSSLGAPPQSSWMPQSSTFTQTLPPQPHPTYPSALPPRAYMGQQVHNNMLPPGHHHQGVGSNAGEGSVYGSINTDQQLGGRFSAPATPSPFSSSGGNPFG